MLRKRLWLLGAVIILISTTWASSNPTAVAQGDPTARTISNLNVRGGPGEENAVLVTIPARTAVVIEGRNRIGNWVLVHTLDGGTRGWVASRYLIWPDGVELAALPVLEEQPSQAAGAPVAVALASLDEASMTALLASVPPVPAATARSRQIFARGQQLGNRPHAFTKVGDCNSFRDGFLEPIGYGRYDLGPYGHLQETITFFNVPLYEGGPNPFNNHSIAAQVGYTSVIVTDPIFSNLADCQPGETLLACDYQTFRPSVALIAFGTLDMLSLTPAQYEQAMRRVLDTSVEQGVIPVLTTAAAGPPGHDRWLRTLEFNTVLVNLAREYDVPLMNFWLATRDLPGGGLDPDLVHVSLSFTGWVRFNGTEDQYGYTAWNWLALQTLDMLRREVLVR